MPEGPFGGRRLTSLGPFVEKSLMTELDSAIGDEQSAGEEYQKLIDLLEQEGFEDQADIVRKIQKDEKRHRQQFINMKRRIERDIDG